MSIIICRQKVATPRGCLVGWKATDSRYPFYYQQAYDRRGRALAYVVGKTYTAKDASRCPLGDFEGTQSAKKLAEARARYTLTCCLPGIHLCKTSKAAARWAQGRCVDKIKIIPVAYSPKSIVGKKSGNIVVVHRIKVLG